MQKACHERTWLRISIILLPASSSRRTIDQNLCLMASRFLVFSSCVPQAERFLSLEAQRIIPSSSKPSWDIFLPSVDHVMYRITLGQMHSRSSSFKLELSRGGVEFRASFDELSKFLVNTRHSETVRVRVAPSSTLKKHSMTVSLYFELSVFSVSIYSIFYCLLPLTYQT